MLQLGPTLGASMRAMLLIDVAIILAHIAIEGKLAQSDLSEVACVIGTPSELRLKSGYGGKV